MVASRTCTRRVLSSKVRLQLQQTARHYSAPTDGAIPPNKAKYVPTSGTYPKGFMVGSAHAQVKASNTKFDDLALIASERPCAASAVFTRNAFKAAPVHVSKSVLDSCSYGRLRGVIINSGCANAVTGQGGLNDATDMATRASNALAERFPHHISDREESPKGEAKKIRSLVMSTGVIGQRLPIDRITSKIPELVGSLGSSHDHWLRTARAICTTDTFPKLLSRQYTLPSYPNVTFSMAGMTKGAGMIHPNMATLLGVICTDAPITSRAVRSLLSSATDRSFNRITIDGDTSTNDTVAFFANGLAAPEGSGTVDIKGVPKGEVAKGKQLEQQSKDYKVLLRELQSFMEDLAKLVVRDGEGATKFVTIRVENALNNEVAKTIASSIAQSALVKTALYGKDANWGRILCAIGYAPGSNGIIPEQTSVSFLPTDGSDELKLVVDGEPQNVDEVRAKAILEMEDLEIMVKLSHQDRPHVKTPRMGHAVIYTCDFSHEYVTINGDYRT